ncbi:MAG: hypothetical protein ABTD50_23375 [Polyangiaceae bacterium]|jgi:hypothetical protein
MTEDVVDNRWEAADESPIVGERVGAGPWVARDARAHAAWKIWLAALATDAEAALSAALAYDSLPAEARNAWLDALEADARDLGVPTLALYAPLLSVESDARRRSRMELAIMSGPVPAPCQFIATRALQGTAPDGTRACIVTAPLYLAFVQVLWCRYRPNAGMVSVLHDPIRHVKDAVDLDDVDGIPVYPAPLDVVIEDLAHAILADRRERRPPSDALASFAHLFGPTLAIVEDVAAR